MIDVKRKTGVIDAELTRLNVNIAAFQETKLANDKCTYPWKCKCQDDSREREVGFAANTSVLPMMVSPTADIGRLISRGLNSSTDSVNNVIAYAPTLNYSPKAKDHTS